MLSKDALEIVLDPDPGFYSCLFLVEKVTGGLATRDRPLSPERVCSANFVQDGDSRLCASVRLRGGFPSFHRSEGRVFPETRSSVVEEAIEVPVGRDSLSVQGPVFWTVDCPTGLHLGVCRCVCMGAVPQDSSSSVPFSTMFNYNFNYNYFSNFQLQLQLLIVCTKLLYSVVYGYIQLAHCALSRVCIL